MNLTLEQRIAHGGHKVLRWMMDNVFMRQDPVGNIKMDKEKSGDFSIGTLILMFILCIPVQLFLHIYFSNAIKSDSFTGIAGFDDKVEYNICEVKKLLVQIDLHIGIVFTAYIFFYVL